MSGASTERGGSPLPMTEEYHEWRTAVGPIVSKLKVGAAFGSAVWFNKDGSEALAKLLEDMATKLDRAVTEDRRHDLRRD